MPIIKEGTDFGRQVRVDVAGFERVRLRRIGLKFGTRWRSGVGESTSDAFDRLDGSVATPYRALSMFDMRNLGAAGLGTLTPTEAEVLRAVAGGASPKDISARVGIPEDELYRLVSWAIDEVEPAPAGMTMADVHAAGGSRPASPDELDEFTSLYGPALPADAEG